MEHEEGAFDVAGFLKLLGEVMPHHGTGVVSARIHVRDGIPWAVSVPVQQRAREGRMTDHLARLLIVTLEAARVDADLPVEHVIVGTASPLPDRRLTMQ
jgi:hypothetical protein